MFKVHRLVYHSTVGSKAIEKKKKSDLQGPSGLRAQQISIRYRMEFDAFEQELGEMQKQAECLEAQQILISSYLRSYLFPD